MDNSDDDNNDDDDLYNFKKKKEKGCFFLFLFFFHVLKGWKCEQIIRKDTDFFFLLNIFSLYHFFTITRSTLYMVMMNYF